MTLFAKEKEPDKNLHCENIRIQISLVEAHYSKIQMFGEILADHLGPENEKYIEAFLVDMKYLRMATNGEVSDALGKRCLEGDELCNTFEGLFAALDGANTEPA